MTSIDIPALRAGAPLSQVAGKYLKLIRTGREWKACCPFHEDRSPSFTINDRLGFYHCFGCGAHGDVLDFIQAIEHVGLRRAAELLGAESVVYRHIERPLAPRDEPETQALAEAIWSEAAPVGGTPAETYLRSRGIVCNLPETVRFAHLRYGARGSTYPCLIAAVTDLNDRLTGIQRTFLNGAETGKAGVPKPKLSLGRIRGGAVRLAPIAGELVLCEGLEDGLTLQQELGVATWATVGVDNLTSVELPLPVRSVVIGADADAAGESGAQKAAQRLVARGLTVRIIRPLDGHKDFNSEILEGRP